jgi:hypothetical protein
MLLLLGSHGIVLHELTVSLNILTFLSLLLTLFLKSLLQEKTILFPLGLIALVLALYLLGIEA